MWADAEVLDLPCEVVLGRIKPPFEKIDLMTFRVHIIPLVTIHTRGVTLLCTEGSLPAGQYIIACGRNVKKGRQCALLIHPPDCKVSVMGRSILIPRVGRRFALVEIGFCEGAFYEAGPGFFVKPLTLDEEFTAIILTASEEFVLRSGKEKRDLQQGSYLVVSDEAVKVEVGDRVIPIP